MFVLRQLFYHASGSLSSLFLLLFDVLAENTFKNQTYFLKFLMSFHSAGQRALKVARAKLVCGSLLAFSVIYVKLKA